MSLKPILQSWEGWCASIVAAVGATVGLLKLIPRLYAAARKFYTGTEFLFNLDETMKEVRGEIHQVRKDVMLRNQIHTYILSVDQVMAWLYADPNGNMLWMNKLWSEWTGRDKEDLLGNGWESSICDSDRARVLMDWQTCISSQRPFEARFALRNRSGTVRVVMYATPKKDETTGVLTLFTGHARLE